MKDGLAISPFYDPMIAKVIAHGATREEARARLVRALRETVVLGPTTNRHFLIRLLEHPDFAAGKATTAFLGEARISPLPTISDAHWTLAAALLWQQPRRERYPAPLRGWRNSNPEPTPIRLAAGGAERAAAGRERPTAPDAPFHIDGNDIVVDLDALTVRFTDKTYAPPATAAAGSDGKLRAPMDGRIVAIKVAAGDTVARGQTLIVLEAMKIQHQLKAVLDAKVESISVQEGQQVCQPDRAGHDGGLLTSCDGVEAAGRLISLQREAQGGIAMLRRVVLALLAVAAAGPAFGQAYPTSRSPSSCPSPPAARPTCMARIVGERMAQGTRPAVHHRQRHRRGRHDRHGQARARRARRLHDRHRPSRHQRRERRDLQEPELRPDQRPRADRAPAGQSACWS